MLVAQNLKNVAIKSYVRKTVLTSATFLNKVKDLPNQKDTAITKNGLTLWKDDNLRLDYSANTAGAAEVFINLQKNKGCTLEGLKGFKTHDKLVTYAVKTGEALTDEELKKTFIEPF